LPFGDLVLFFEVGFFPTSGNFARSSLAAGSFYQTSRPPRDVSGKSLKYGTR
jgi:hypothetical protein